ncbi:MAG: hypothetical protein RLP44_11445 [Aggregatilineales bacterium]
MAKWDWLIQPKTVYTRAFVVRVILKATLLFVLVNLVYVVAQPLATINQMSVYNGLVSGRERFPYADNPTEVYNLSIGSLEGMFAAHEISGGEHNGDEFRVLLLGDSGVWGWLLNNNETFSACMNASGAQTADGRNMRVYNLGYPITNVLKDTLILDFALQYQPDAVVWFTTLEGMYDDDQLSHPVIQSNRDRVLEIIAQNNLSLDTSRLPDAPTVFDNTIIGQRRELADWLRLQFYGVAWGITDFDHTNPRFFRSPVENFPPSEGIPNRGEIGVGELTTDLLAFDVLEAGVNLAQSENLPVLLVNEPIFRGSGANSDLRYNDLYPRWAYDSYREMLGELATENDWNYVDLWDFVPADRFTDFPLHYDAEQTCRVAETLIPLVIELAN